MPLALAFALLLSTAAVAQVATLATPGPEDEPSPSPAPEMDSQDAMLGFSGCMRENGIELPDPQFGGGSFFAGGSMGDIDLLSLEFVAAFARCQGFLAAAIPSVDPEEQAERIERAVAFAECMRAEGIDWPDPDPVSGITFASMIGDDGRLVFDMFDPHFQATSRACAAATGSSIPGMTG